MSHVNRELKRHARAMRNTPTRAEDRLWSWLRDRRCSGIKFRRQTPIGPYIVDFYCAELKFAIELDGTQHRASRMSDYDGERTVYLQKREIRVLRIPNELLIRDSILVGEQISAAIESLRCGDGEPPHPPSAPSPPQAGEKDLDERAFETLLPSARGEGAEGG
jgi:very-short-patch-repair endonuclease